MKTWANVREPPALPGVVREIWAGQGCLVCLSSGEEEGQRDFPVYSFYRGDGSLITALCPRHLAAYALPCILAADLLPKGQER